MDPLFLGLRHVALNVKDVRQSLEFYSTVLGMRLEWMPDGENAYLTSGPDNLALHQLPTGAEPGRVQNPPSYWLCGTPSGRRGSMGGSRAEGRHRFGRRAKNTPGRREVLLL